MNNYITVAAKLIRMRPYEENKLLDDVICQAANLIRRQGDELRKLKEEKNVDKNRPARSGSR